MSALAMHRRMWEHAVWADREILHAIAEGGSAVPDEAIREFAHTLGAAEVWLARLEGRSPRYPVWPDVDSADLLEEMVRQIHESWTPFLAGLQESDLSRVISYTNSAGRAFENVVDEILTHVSLHGQYHRGKVNLMLRGAGLMPAPVDYIAFVRGAPAATRGDSL